MNKKSLIILIVAFLAILAADYYLISSRLKAELAEESLKSDPEIKTLVESTRQTVMELTKGHKMDNYTLQNSKTNAKIFQSIYQNLQKDFIFRIKVWDTDFQVVYSNAQELIGKRFPDNIEVKESYEGEEELEIKTDEGGTDKTELSTEYSYKNFVEIYTPIRDDQGKIIGVFEVYRPISEQITKKTNNLLLQAGIIVVVSFGILGLIYFVSRKL